MAVHKPPATSNKVAQAAAAQADIQSRQKTTLRGIAQVKKLQLPTKTVAGKSVAVVKK